MVRAADDIRFERSFIRIFDASKTANLAGPCFPVQIFGVAEFTNRELRIDIDLQEVADGPTGLVAELAIRRDRGDENHDAVARQQFCNESDAANILISIGLAKTEVLAEVISDHIAIDHFHSQPASQELGGYGVANGRFAGRAKAGEPDCDTVLGCQIQFPCGPLGTISAWL